MKIAIYGGSFNPMHIGHEKIVDYVLKNLDMDKIIIIPVGIPSHRENNLEQSDTRLKICKEIFKNNKKVEVSDIEIKSEGKSYTYDTLLKLIKIYGKDNEFFEIIGEDSLKNLKTWKNYKELLNLCKFIVFRRKYDKNTEITIEVNPKTVNSNKLKEYRKLGINRLSIGIQTFNDDNLKLLGRIHNSEEAIEVYNLARECRFDNISLDIMFSLPNQTLSMLQNDLEKLVNLNPNHISIYSLIWEEGTKFYRDLKAGKLQEADNDLEATMYEYIINFLVE